MRENSASSSLTDGVQDILYNETTPILCDSQNSKVVEIPTIIEEDAPKSSWWSCLFNLSNTAIGAGILTIPFLFSQVGLLFGSLLVILVGGVNTLTLHYLSIAHDVTGAKSYIGIAKHFYGKKGEYVLTTTMFILLMSPLCAYLTIIVDYTTGAIGPFRGDIPWYNRKYFLTGIVVILLFPLSLMKTPRSLGFVSLLSLFALFYTAVLILASFLQDATDADWEYPDISLAKIDFSLISTFSTMCVAFINHTTHVEIISELRSPSWNRKTGLIVSSYAIIVIVYLAVGISGYLHYGKSVDSNILKSEPSDMVFQIGRICISLSSFLSYPLMMIPARACLDWILHEIYTFRQIDQTCSERLANWENRRTFRFYIETFSIMVTSYILAIYLTGLAKIFALFGALGGSVVVYIFPASYFLKTDTSPTIRNRFFRIFACLNIVIGFFLLFVGTFYAIYSAM